jgi:hypothetical protein
LRLLPGLLGLLRLLLWLGGTRLLLLFGPSGARLSLLGSGLRGVRLRLLFGLLSGLLGLLRFGLSGTRLLLLFGLSGARLLLRPRLRGALLWRLSMLLRRGGLTLFLASLTLCEYCRSKKQEDRNGPRYCLEFHGD